VPEPESKSKPPQEHEKARDEDEPMLYCPVCSTRLSQHKCKLVCPQCGYYMSCADYY
jgi:ribosomal protein S27AE